MSSGAEGSITPQAVFSDELQKELSAEARSAAIADARLSAERSANDIGLNLGDVVSVNDSRTPDFYYGYPDVRVEAQDAAASVPVQPGENEIAYSVEVVFEAEK